MEQIRACVHIEGIVQGVGFRPFVYNLARTYDLSGWVLNNEQGVTLEVEGERLSVERFLSGLSRPPRLAVVEKTEVSYHAPVGYSGFEIRESVPGSERLTLISPDIATCPECLAELLDPGDRRFRYPFTNCTNCGPRFTIIEDIPYDRKFTTMEAFEMCPQCSREYHDPSNRRFHAQPNACPACGPELRLLSGTGEELSTADPLVEAISLLRKGKIIAIKGLGGFHLACDATNETAVSRLRGRKYREDKPFAVMCRDIEVAAKCCRITPLGKRLLEGKERPIVVLQKKEANSIAPSVAPHQRTLGIMLPYSPLHHLLFTDGLDVLVMTSGNVSDEPITFNTEEAITRLAGIAEYFLIHNRTIHTRCDDSVIQPREDTLTLLRRSRGYAPAPIKLPKKGRSVLACGAEIKNTFCLTRGDVAFVSHHIGDMENTETLSSFEQGIELLTRLFQVTPELVVYDLHPEYLATRYAKRLRLPSVGIQHHAAHALSCMAEHGRTGRTLAVVMDGTGYGEDGTVWGGEVLELDVHTYRRCGHLKYIPLPGGDRAIKEPWRLAAAYLSRTYGNLETLGIPFTETLDHEKWSRLEEAMKAEINCPPCSSAGRLFDAVSAILGVRELVNYEGQAAVELEQIADGEEVGAYPFEIDTQEGSYVLDPDPAITAIVEELQGKVPTSRISSRFHSTVARMIRELLTRLRGEVGINEVVLSGGVFQNALLTSRTVSLLEEQGFLVLTHQAVPPNDGGISLGQALYGIYWEEDLCV
ncbi:MAG: carbamoyltransferase HypF [Deltaproteobacteria bacterium]|nr:carbamoyltransferase HypF [Deltaproteobacteria bacterium]